MPTTDAGWHCRTWVFSLWYTTMTSRIDITTKDRTDVTAKLDKLATVVTQVANKVEIETYRRKHDASERHHQLYHRSQVTRRHEGGSAVTALYKA